MTDTLHALFHRTWLLHCDICEEKHSRVGEWCAPTCDHGSGPDAA